MDCSAACARRSPQHEDKHQGTKRGPGELIALVAARLRKWNEVRYRHLRTTTSRRQSETYRAENRRLACVARADIAGVVSSILATLRDVVHLGLRQAP